MSKISCNVVRKVVFEPKLSQLQDILYDFQEILQIADSEKRLFKVSTQICCFSPVDTSYLFRILRLFRKMLKA